VLQSTAGWTESRERLMERAGSRRQGSGVVRRRRALGAERSAGHRREERGALFTKRLPRFREAKGPSCEKNYGHRWEWAARPRPGAGALQVLA